MAKVFLTKLGDRCDSDYERAVLDDLTDRGVNYKYEHTDGKFFYQTPVQSGLCLACDHNKVVQRRYRTLDIVLENGIVVEIKGRLTGTIRTFMRELIKQNQDVDIRFFFMQDGWQNQKTKKRTYGDWANAQGIKWAVGDPRANEGTVARGVGGIPQEWIDE